MWLLSRNCLNIILRLLWVSALAFVFVFQFWFGIEFSIYWKFSLFPVIYLSEFMWKNMHLFIWSALIRQFISHYPNKINMVINTSFIAAKCTIWPNRCLIKRQYKGQTQNSSDSLLEYFLRKEPVAENHSQELKGLTNVWRSRSSCFFSLHLDEIGEILDRLPTFSRKR